MIRKKHRIIVINISQSNSDIHGRWSTIGYIAVPVSGGDCQNVGIDILPVKAGLHTNHTTVSVDIERYW